MEISVRFIERSLVLWHRFFGLVNNYLNFGTNFAISVGAMDGFPRPERACDKV